MKLSAIVLALALSCPTLYAYKAGVPSVERDAHGRIRRSARVKREFERTHPCPVPRTNGHCVGFVLDHTIPLCKGGPDAAWNLQWQTLEDSKVKDKWECSLR